MFKFKKRNVEEKQTYPADYDSIMVLIENEISKKEISRRKLAFETNVAPSTMCKYIKGTNTMPYDTIYDSLKYLGFDVVITKAGE